MCYNKLNKGLGMNVISGKYKGRKLFSANEKVTRSTLNRVKESLFCMIDEYIYNSNCLDLFAGSGALGIECLSRGARRVVFCDNNAEAISVIKKNLKNVTEDYIVLFEDYLQALAKIKNERFDVIFLDPPYQSLSGETALDFILKNNMLNSGGIVVFEHDAKKSLQSLCKDCIITKQKVYGNKAIDIISFKG